TGQIVREAPFGDSSGGEEAVIDVVSQCRQMTGEIECGGELQSLSTFEVVVWARSPAGPRIPGERRLRITPHRDDSASILRLLMFCFFVILIDYKNGCWESHRQEAMNAMNAMNAMGMSTRSCGR